MAGTGQTIHIPVGPTRSAATFTPAMAATARAADPGNGAPAAADAIRELVSLPSTGAVR